jgi:hypothetical protein
MILADFLGTTWFIALVAVIGILAGAWLYKKFGHKLHRPAPRRSRLWHCERAWPTGCARCAK